jgi:hypothetical protein
MKQSAASLQRYVLMGLPVIYCRIKRRSVGGWFIESVYAGHLAWTGAHWVSHVDAASTNQIAIWESKSDAKKHAQINGFVVID